MSVPMKANLECILNRISIICINYYIFIRTEMEEWSLQVRGQMQQIFKVLSKDEHDKMPFQGIQIAKSLSHFPFFRRFFDTNSELFINLCIAQDAVIFAEGTEIYQKEASDGHERYIYVILEGKVQISSQKCATRQLGILRIFGQTQILFGLQSRKQSVITLEECKVMRIKQTAILKIFNKKDDITKCQHFIDVNEYFKGLTDLEKMHVSLSMVRRQFQKGTVLKSEGQRFDEIVFLIYGKVEVTTHLKKKSKDKQFVIDYLEELSSYGEYESTTGLGTSFKLRGLIAGAYYSLNYAEIKRQGYKVADVIQEKAIPYPSSEEIEFLEGVKSTLRREEGRVKRSLFRGR